MFKSIVVFVVLAVFVSANILPVKKQNGLKDAPSCIVCEYAVTYLENQIRVNSTQNEIIQALETACQIAPAQSQDECKAYVSEYAPTIIYFLLKEAKPEEICKVIGAC